MDENAEHGSNTEEEMAEAEEAIATDTAVRPRGTVHTMASRETRAVAEVAAARPRPATTSGGVIAPPRPPTPGNPPFPLPSGHWFGPESDNDRNHSGFAPADRPGVAAIRRRLRALKFRVVNGDRYNTALAAVVKQFQRGKGIEADGLVGRQTWNALW